MKKISTIWLITSLTVVPCFLNFENMWACVAFVINLALAALCAKRHNPSMFV